MILGVPFAFLACLWLGWSAGATLDGDPSVRTAAIVLAALLASVGAAITWRGGSAARIALGIALLSGAVGTLRATTALRDSGPTSPITISTVRVRGTVIEPPEWRGATQYVPMHIEAVATAPGRWEVSDGNATMHAPLDHPWALGDVLEATPGHAARTWFTGHDARLIASASATAPTGAMVALRRRLALPVEAWLPEPEAALATGTLLGDRTGVPAWLRSDFNATGAAHLVAISGWNVSVVAASIEWLTTRGKPRRLRPWQLSRDVAISVALWAFVALVGASGSVLRAAVMAQVGILARTAGRRAASAGTLLWAAVVMVGLDPSTLDDIGWQLSFLGAAGLIWLAPWLVSRTTPPPNAWWRWMFPHAVREAVAAAIAAQVCVLPVIAGSLGSVPLIGLFATTPGLLLIPPLMAATAILSVAGVVLPIWPAVAAVVLPVVATIAWTPATLLVRMVTWAASLPGTSTTAPPWHPAAVVAYVVGLALLIAVAESTPRRRSTHTGAGSPTGTALAVVTVLAAIMLVAVPDVGAARASGTATGDAQGRPRVTGGPGPSARVIVPTLGGQGAGTLVVVSVRGGPRLLVGGGPSIESGVEALGPVVRPWDRRIDAIVAMSSDGASMLGAGRVLTRYPVGAIVDTLASATNGAVLNLRAQAASAGVPTVSVGNGTPFVIGDPSRVPAGVCPATSAGTAVLMPIGASPPRLGASVIGPTAWPAVAVRVCAGWADVTVVPDVAGAAIWLAHAPESERWPLRAPSGRSRWLVVPWRAWRTGALDALREAVDPAVTIVQGAPEPWRSKPTRPTLGAGDWWLAPLDGPLDVGDDW